MHNMKLHNQVYVFDLDGTIALNDHRQHFLEGDPKDWDAFFEACDEDDPNYAIIYLMRALNKMGFTIYIVTGRSGNVEQKTRDWLRHNRVPYDGMAMRGKDDYRHDTKIKPMLLQSLLSDTQHVHAIFDDRNSVVEMWRDNGYQCFHVADGDF